MRKLFLRKMAPARPGMAEDRASTGRSPLNMVVRSSMAVPLWKIVCTASARYAAVKPGKAPSNCPRLVPAGVVISMPDCKTVVNKGSFSGATVSTKGNKGC